MTGRERALRALRLQAVDYPPAWAPIICSTRSIEEILGRTDIWADPAQAYLAAYQALKGDMINQFLPYRPGDFSARTAVVDQRLPPMEPEEVAGRMREKRSDLRRSAADLDETRVGDAFAQQAAAGQAFAGGDLLWVQYDGAFSLPVMRYAEFGYESYFAFLATYPEVQEEVWGLEGEFAFRHNRAIAAAMDRHRLPRVVRLDHDMTDSRGSIVRPDLLDRIYFPHLKRALAPFVEAGVRLVWHCDGNVNDFVPRLLDAGVNGFQGFQEECGVDLDAMCGLRDRNGDPVMIWGSVSVTRVLPFGTPDDVRTDVRRCWRAAPDRGFVLGATSSICPEVPTANIIAMFDEHTTCRYR